MAHTELSEEVALKLKPLRFSFCLALVFFILPMLQMAFWSDSIALGTFLWMIPGVVIAVVVALVENFLSRPLQVSAQFIENYTFETFVLQRYFRSKEIDH